MTFDQWLDEPNPIAPSRSRRECYSARVIADFKTGWDAANDQIRQAQAQAGEPQTLPVPASGTELADVNLLWRTHCLLENLLNEEKIEGEWQGLLQDLADSCAIAFKQQRRAALAAEPSDSEPLSHFAEGQWWVEELDAMVRSDAATADQKRAVAVVHHLLRALRQGTAAPASVPAVSEPAILTEARRIADSEERASEVLTKIRTIMNASGKWSIEDHIVDAIRKLATTTTDPKASALEKDAARMDEAFGNTRAALLQCPDRASIRHILDTLRAAIASTSGESGHD